MATVTETHGERIYADFDVSWVETGTFRPPYLRLGFTLPDKQRATIELSGDEIGRLRDALNHTPGGF